MRLGTWASTIATLVVAACNSNPAVSGSEDARSTAAVDPVEPDPIVPDPVVPDPVVPDPFAIGPGKPADPPSATAIDAPIATELPPLAFWDQGDAACEPGGRLDGALPPAMTEIRCVDAEGRWTGMEARFHEGLPIRLQMIGRKRDGRMEGVWLWFDASGNKIAEHAYRDGVLHGTVRRWAANGQEIESSEYRAGRPWGLSVIRDESGKELARSQLVRGTGVLIGVDAHARTESDYVNGLLHGKHRRFHLQGRKIAESDWSGGEWHGLQIVWDERGQKTVEDQYKLGQQHGPATRWHDGQIVERSIHFEGRERSRQLYRDDQPLAPLPATTPCETDPGLSAMLQTTRGSGLPREHACVTRMALFPGVIMLGDFAYDHGCMGANWVVDCKLVEPGPSAADLLARAGWAKATPEQRLVIAEEYVREFGLAYAGSISSTPDEAKWTNLADGGVEAMVWVAEPSGMRQGRELDQLRFSFAADGTLTRTNLGHRSEGRD